MKSYGCPNLVRIFCDKTSKLRKSDSLQWSKTLDISSGIGSPGKVGNNGIQEVVGSIPIGSTKDFMVLWSTDRPEAFSIVTSFVTEPPSAVDLFCQKLQSAEHLLIRCPLIRRAHAESGKSVIENHLITLSALTSTFGGIVRPICFAVFRLMMNSNLIGCSTGRSAGLAPFRILSTNRAATAPLPSRTDAPRSHRDKDSIIMACLLRLRQSRRSRNPVVQWALHPNQRCVKIPAMI